jgi:hypothetical protein
LLRKEENLFSAARWDDLVYHWDIRND